MCRWIAYTGKPIYMDALVTLPSHSLIAQSLNAKRLYNPDGSILTINGDGFGIGWYADKPEPGLFKVADPAWSNENINEICGQIKAHTFMAHVRAASIGAIQRSNAHPFKYGNWLFQHNGRVLHFDAVRRDLQLAIAPELYPLLRGTTDSETLFLLTLTHGLESDPKTAIVRMIESVQRACSERGVPFDLILSCAISDGKSLYTVRYSSAEQSNSQYYSTHASCMKDIDEHFNKVPTDSVVVVSEPLDSLDDYWKEMPDNSFSSIRDGQVSITAL